jgi:ABC-type nickel/cobalt efflux system permease component RcnA
MTPAFVALALLAAAAWGAAHALGPGHGKTIVAAYLVGSQGTARHAFLLGLTVTATHTSTVIALGLVTLYASRFVAAEDLYLWLSVGSGLLVVALGLILLGARLRRFLSRPAAAHGHDHGHMHHDRHDPGHGHSHDHAPSHSHVPASPGLRGLIALGISGGLLPCPTALVVMLGAIALDRVVFGLVLVLAFSVGLAGVLTGIGIALVYANRLLSGSSRLGSALGRIPFSSRWLQLAPLASAFVVLVAGLILTGRALTEL